MEFLNIKLDKGKNLTPRKKALKKRTPKMRPLKKLSLRLTPTQKQRRFKERGDGENTIHI